MTALGRQPDRKLRYFAQIIDHDALARGEQGQAPGIMLTEPDELEQDVSWQGGCIVENEPTVLFGGVLARFDAPVRFAPLCAVDSRGIGMYSGADLFRWDMQTRDGLTAAITGPAGEAGEFSVSWSAPGGHA